MAKNVPFFKAQQIKEKLQKKKPRPQQMFKINSFVFIRIDQSTCSIKAARYKMYSYRIGQEVYYNLKTKLFKSSH
jgi:hypothetical protein